MLIYKGKAADYFYQQTGEGIPVIFAHGLFVDYTIFDTQVESLQESYTCYSLDLPAHGKSTFNPDGWTLEDIAEDLSLIPISEPTRRTPNSYAVFCLKKKKSYHISSSNTYYYFS